MTGDATTEEAKRESWEAPLGLLLLGPYLLWWGYTASCLWAWFAVPLGFPVIKTVHAGGLAVLLLFLRKNEKTKSDEKDMLTRLLEGVFTVGLLLGFGYLFHICM